MDHSTILFLLLGVAVVIAAARIGGRIAQRFRQPAVVGEITAGILLGPSLLGLLPGDPSSWLFPTDVRPLLGALAQIGLVLFMFIVGLELDMRLINGRERAAAAISISSIAVPFALGAVLAALIYPFHDIVDGEQISRLGLMLFIGVAMSITAFPVLARILTDRGMQRTVPGVFSLAAAAVDDILAWTILALVIAIIQGGSPMAVAEIVGMTLVYTIIMFVVVKPLLRKLVARHERAGRLTPDILGIILVGLFLSAAATEWIGIHQILGAFIFGAVMPKVGAEKLQRDILDRLELASVLLLLPMFFVVTGLQVDLAGMSSDAWWQLPAILAVACLGKFAGAYVGARTSKIPTRQSGAIAILMNTRGLTELVILSAGREIGVLSDELFAMMVVMALITTIMAEPLLRLVYPPSMVDKDIAAAERRALTAGTAGRVMVVLDDLDGDVEQLRERYSRSIAVARGTDLVLAGLLPTGKRGPEVAVPVGPDFAAMASAVEKLNALGAALPGVGSVSALCRFSADPGTDVEEMARNAGADIVVVDRATEGLDAMVEAVRCAPVIIADPGATEPLPIDAPSVVCLAGDDRDGRTAILLAATVAAHSGKDLTVVSPQSRRRLTAELRPVAARDVGITVMTPKSLAGIPDGSMIAGSGVEVGRRRPAYTVIDRQETSEESLGDRISELFAEGGDPTLAGSPT